RVLQFATGERWLQLNEGVAIHSDYKPWTYLTGGYWDDFDVLPLASVRGAPRRIAILGDAAGTVARAYGHYFPRTHVAAVELAATLRAVFPFVMGDRFDKSNSFVVASSAPLSAGRMLAAARALPPELGALAANVAGRLGPALGGGAVYTDDRAPIEWLTDLSIV